MYLDAQNTSESEVNRQKPSEVRGGGLKKKWFNQKGMGSW